jgi:hypothetical protein
MQVLRISIADPHNPKLGPNFFGTLKLKEAGKKMELKGEHIAPLGRDMTNLVEFSYLDTAGAALLAP